VDIHTLAPAPDDPDQPYVGTGHPRRGIPARLGRSPAMARVLVGEGGAVDLIHDHGLWMMPNIYAARAARAAGRPLVYSVHGMLAPWALNRSRLKKRVVGLLGQDSALRRATCLHATAPSEVGEIRAVGLRQPVAVIPYGIDVPDRLPPRAPGDRRTLLFLSRIHPKKGVEVLLRAWQRVQGRFPEWDLVVAGPDNEGHLAAMEGLAANLGLQRVSFPGPRYGADRDALMDRAEILVLPTFNENFGFVVAEALARGRPVVCTRAAPWAGLQEHRCGWWIETGVDALAACLDEALAADAGTLADMGARGREWVRRDLSWDRVGEMMAETYQWVLGRAGQPAWVETD
jgi:glycosyltransferase involved in cell wall biosynthesis